MKINYKKIIWLSWLFCFIFVAYFGIIALSLLGRDAVKALCIYLKGDAEFLPNLTKMFFSILPGNEVDWMPVPFLFSVLTLLSYMLIQYRYPHFKTHFLYFLLFGYISLVVFILLCLICPFAPFAPKSMGG